MTKPVTGQYECLHRSGVGLDYFTSRIDRLTLQANGRFILIIQDGSRIAQAAKSVMNGQQVAVNAPETRREGNYTVQGNALAFRFDNGAQEQGQVSWNGDGMQFGPNFFNKVSDSTLLPSPTRLKKDMDDIARGLKIASTIGGMAIKAAKTIHDTMQTTQAPGIGPTAAPSQTPQPRQSMPSAPLAQPEQSVQPVYSPPPTMQQPATSAPQQGSEALFCDQCGARARPGKRFCNNCGAQLP
ncbi:MAG: hypothetical protein NVS4B7_07120 [Ktedonobacteraceae bacterium]